MPFAPPDPEQQQRMLPPQQQRQGLMGPAAPPGPRQPNFLDRILGLYGSDPSSHIPEEERGGALRRGLREAGIATAMAGGRGHDSLTTAQALAIFAGTMQGTGGRIGAEKDKELLSQLVSSGKSPAEMKQVMMQLLADGSPESTAAAKTIQAYLSSGQGQFTLGENDMRFDVEGNPIASGKGGPLTPGGVAFDDLTKVDLGDVIQYRDPMTGELKHQYRKQDSAKLRGDYNKVIDDHYVVAQNLATIEASAQNPSAAGDLAMIFAYMKVLDPGSVVRESEFQNAANTANIPERIVALRNFYFENGRRLSDTMRADFLNRARMIAGARRGQLQQTSQWYTDAAKRQGVDHRDVVRDPFALYKNEIDAAMGEVFQSPDQIDEKPYMYPGELAPGQAGPPKERELMVPELEGVVW